VVLKKALKKRKNFPPPCASNGLIGNMEKVVMI
jgi:hypothetical protein